jgi:hypothetical protein
MRTAVPIAIVLLLGQSEPEAGAAPAEASPSEAPAAPAAGEPGAGPARPPRGRPRQRTEGEQAGAVAPAVARQPAGQPVAGRPPEPERSQVARAALSFLDPLLAGDATELSRACGERFSFDGVIHAGREDIRQTFRELLDRREGTPRPVLLDLEVLPAADALSRLGPPPPRLAALSGGRGTWVAMANVSRRPVVLFLAREGNRWVVVGMHG